MQRTPPGNRNGGNNLNPDEDGEDGDPPGDNINGMDALENRVSQRLQGLLQGHLDERLNVFTSRLDNVVRAIDQLSTAFSDGGIRTVNPPTGLANGPGQRAWPTGLAWPPQPTRGASATTPTDETSD